jgi:hypothetical protein
MIDTLHYELLNNKINMLQNLIDSLNNLTDLNQMQFELNKKQDIITQVNSFYDSAWAKLIIVISLLGVAVPLLIQYIQRKDQKEKDEFMRKILTDNFNNQLSELKNSNKTEIDRTIEDYKKMITELEKKNEMIFNASEASTFFLQGLIMQGNKRFISAIESFIKAAFFLEKSNNYNRIPVTLYNLKQCFKNLQSAKDIITLNNKLSNSALNGNLEDNLRYIEMEMSFSDLETKKTVSGFIKEINFEIERIKTLK